MKKKIVIFSVLLTVCMFLCVAAGCDSRFELSENIIDDKYDNFYEIFVYSFFDSDGNGVGDLNGVTEKLDYIRGMGYTALWLMPISPSPSYHKYEIGRAHV